MSATALHLWLEREHVRAAALLRLDDELGTRHGMSWADFVLLQCLDEAAGPLPQADLAARLGMLRSHCLMRVQPLEKVGLVSRRADAKGSQAVSLSASGRRLLREARETAANVCDSLESR
jgi:MarR family transcriptional regulator, organic hydroperoxide resistance regulator